MEGKHGQSRLGERKVRERERGGSLGNTEEFWRRKRKRSEE